MFEFIASLPPLRITAFPDLKHRLETSEATLGLLSNITPITPIGIESFDKVDYLRIPSIDGLLGIQAQHATAIIGLKIGEMEKDSLVSDNPSLSLK